MKKAFLLLFIWGIFFPVYSAETPSIIIRKIQLSTPDAFNQSKDQSTEKRSFFESLSIAFVGLKVPNEQTLIKHLKRFIGRVLTKEELLAIKSEILAHYNQVGFPLMIAQIPEQDVSEGNVTVVVIESRASQIIIRDNHWFSSRKIKRRIRLNPGDRISKQELLDDVSWMNRNPFLNTEVVLTPGKEENTTDVELSVKDRFPLRIYVGADNTGTDFTGNARFYGGINWGNALGLGDLLTYQYTTTTEITKFQSHFGQYISYLPWKHLFNLYGGYSKTNPEIPDFRSEGKSAQGSLRYTIPVKPLYLASQHQLEFGFDFKNTNSDLFFIGSNQDPIISKTVNVTQLVTAYLLSYASKFQELAFNVELFVSPGSIVSNQSNDNFASLRANAKNRYVYSRALFSDIIQLPHELSLALLMRGQLSSRALIPSEQFGLGGYNTVRGFNEREFNADNAICANVELRSPHIRFKDIPAKKVKSDLFFLAFVDYGFGHDHNADVGLRSTIYLLSAGSGLRFYVNNNLSFRADYGFVIHHPRIGGRSFGKVHVGGMLSF